jgi:hypothetical protein
VKAGAQLSQIPGKSPEIGLKMDAALFIMTNARQMEQI